MMHSIVCPSMGHAIVHHFGEGAAAWGQVITPSIAHLVQSQREIPIYFSRVRPGIVFEVETGIAMLPHVMDASTLRLHIGTTAFRHATGRPDATVETFIRLNVDSDCTLKFWGRASAEGPTGQEPSGKPEMASTVPVVFSVTFWEISRADDARFDQLQRESTAKDQEIQQLRAQVVLAMCSQ